LRINNEPFALSSITATDPTLTTPRGLRVGDTAEALFVLYGIPVSVLDNVWTYGDGDYNIFHVTVRNGVVEQLWLHAVM